MNQPTTQPNIINRFFKIKAHGSSVGTEIIAGFTTFLTMVYIIFVNPNILAAAGMDPHAVFVITCLISAFASILMGLFANLPIALAPAMGLNVFFAFVIVLTKGYSWQVGMGAIFWGSLFFFLLSLLHIRYWLISNIPYCLRLGISSGIGLFISMMGLQNMGIVVNHETTLITVGNLASIPVLLGSLGFLIIVILAVHQFHAAVLVAISVVTLLALKFDPNVTYNGIIAMPPNMMTVVGHIDLAGSFNIGIIGVIFSVMIISLFDSSGTMIAVTQKAELIDKDGKFPKMKQALLVDSASSTLGGLFGASSVLTYIESSTGVSVGGRTGLTAIVVGILFLLVIFLSPLAKMVPIYATAGALVYVGILMTSSLVKLNWDDLTEAVPAFITTVMMPFSFAITEGVAFGFISYCLIKLCTGRYREISTCVWCVALLFLLKFIFIDH